MATPVLDALTEAMCVRIADLVVDRLRVGEMPGYIDQSASPLGRRRHIALVRGGKGVQIGRRYLAKIEDVEAELAAHKPRKCVAHDDDADVVAAKLGLA